MALEREDINFENIKRDAKIEALVNSVVKINTAIAHLKDEQFEMRNEIERRDETISKLKNDIQLLEKDKRWNMLWRNSLSDSIIKTEISVFVVGVINIIFAYLISR